MQRKKVDTLICGGTIIPMGSAEIIENGAIAIQGGTIVEVGATERIESVCEAERTIDAAGKAVLPGFVDTHHHFLQHYLKGPRDDVDLPQWIEHVSAPVITRTIRDFQKGNNDMQLVATRLGCLEAVKMGITTILNMEWATHPDLLDVYDLVGNRVVHTLTFTDIDEWDNPDMLLPIPRCFELADALIEKCKVVPKQRVEFRYGIADEICATSELVKDIRAAADRSGKGIHLHMAETKRSVEKIGRLYGCTPVAYLDGLYLLKSDVLGAHCIYMNDADLDIMARTGATVSHNPEANTKIAEGIAPVAEMLDRGIPVSLGTDTVAANDNMDMFEAMRLAAFLQKVTTEDPTRLPAYSALEMATLGGARALEMEDQIGSLEAGKKADLILVDIDSLHMQPRNSIVNNLVYCASAASDVDTVLIEGDVVVRDGELVHFDEKSEIARFKDFAKRELTREGLVLPSYY